MILPIAVVCLGHKHSAARPPLDNPEQQHASTWTEVRGSLRRRKPPLVRLRTTNEATARFAWFNHSSGRHLLLGVASMSARQHTSRRPRYCWWLLGVLAYALPGLAAEPYREDAVKAAFLYRFTGYIEWPEQVLQSRPQFTIAVLDGDSVAKELSRLLTRRAIKNMPARVKKIDSPRQVGDAQMLYVGTDYAGNRREFISALAGKPVLIVTDHPRGLDDGGAVNFMRVDRRVRFEVSLTAAQNAGIKVSSELLSVATRVRGAQLRTQMACATPGRQLDLGQFCNQRLARL